MSIIVTAEAWDIGTLPPEVLLPVGTTRVPEALQGAEVTVDDKKRRELFTSRCSKMLADEAARGMASTCTRASS